MSDETKEVVVIEEQKNEVMQHTGAPLPTESVMDRMWSIAGRLMHSGAVPKNLSKDKTSEQLHADVFAVIAAGNEVGFRPLQALQAICIINGKVSIYGDGIPALLRMHPSFEYMKERSASEAFKAGAGECIIKRKGQPEHITEFSVEDAKRASLWTKPIWKQYPGRMLQMRARSWAARDMMADALSGLYMAEEAQDFHIKDVTPDGTRVCDDCGARHKEVDDNCFSSLCPECSDSKESSPIPQAQLDSLAVMYSECQELESGIENEGFKQHIKPFDSVIDMVRQYSKNKDVQEIPDLSKDEFSETMMHLSRHKKKLDTMEKICIEFKGWHGRACALADAGKWPNPEPPSGDVMDSLFPSVLKDKAKHKWMCKYSLENLKRVCASLDVWHARISKLEDDKQDTQG